MKRVRFLLFVATIGLTFTTSLVGQPPAGDARERMWPAPTTEDWKRPCLIQWQRTWDDALAVAKETQRPLLVCINMDGEIASEHYAGIRYRDPEITKLYAPYVTVIASVYRHTPRDYDENGERIPCPRFGGVTCGEHMDIEPIVFEKFCEGRRIAPRHICVDLAGQESYDVYYAFDTQSVFDTIKDGSPTQEPVKILRGDRSIVERVGSRDSRDREAVEAAYRNGDEALRRALLDAASASMGSAPVELLRQAVFGFDPELSGVARSALAKSETTDSIGVIREALRVPLPEGERSSLIGALEQIGKNSEVARTLAIVYRGMGQDSDVVRVTEWSDTLAERPMPQYLPAETISTRVGDQLATLNSQDAPAKLALGEALIARGLERWDNPRYDRLEARALFEDAKTAALDAEALGSKGWPVNSTIAIAAYYLNDLPLAYGRAEAAMADPPKDPESETSILVLGLFADARRTSIHKAVTAQGDWPGQWLTDLHATYSVIAEHPLASDDQVVVHHDFLTWFGAHNEAFAALQRGLERFPASAALHERFRSRLLFEKGAQGLESAYEAITLASQGTDREKADTYWFAGYASLVAAEFHRKERRAAEAVVSYGRSVSLLERAIGLDPEVQATSDPVIALALAGQARIEMERGDVAAATNRLVASFERHPDSAGTLDGLNISPADTARTLKVRIGDAQRPDLLDALNAAMAKVNPKLLGLPAYEREVPPAGERPRPPRRRNGR